MVSFTILLCCLCLPIEHCTAMSEGTGAIRGDHLATAVSLGLAASCVEQADISLLLVCFKNLSRSREPGASLVWDQQLTEHLNINDGCLPQSRAMRP